MAVTALSHVYPLGSRLNEAGRLEVGGCDTVELAREFGTPAYVMAEDDLRARARTFREALATHHGDDGEVVFASKALPCTAAYRVFAREDLACDAATGGELHLALRGGFEPARVYLHGNAKSERELREGIEAGVGHIVIDNFDDIDRLECLVPAGSGQPVLLRVRPGVKPSTHDFISTGQLDSKFGLALDDARAAIERLLGSDRLELRGLHMHIGSQIFELGSFRQAVEAIAGVAYTAEDEPPAIEAYVQAKATAVREILGAGKRLVIEPGRALVANAGVTLYTVETVKCDVSTYVAVDGGMSDNLRPMLYGAVYEATIADRPAPGGELCRVAGKHCESSDVIVHDVHLHDPRPGDVLVTPATGAYGHAMANNYNGVPRPPVIFCRDGEARVVVRRETYEDLAARDEF